MSLQFTTETTVNGVVQTDLTKITEVYDAYFKNLQKKLDDIGKIVVAGIRENISTRNYEGGFKPVHNKSGTPLIDTGQLYNSIISERIDDGEVDVFINGDRSIVGSKQWELGRHFFTIERNTQARIDEILKMVMSEAVK